jgi:hypothetical protein
MSFQDLIESKIKDAIEAGAFVGLRGEGEPLKTIGTEALAGDNWMGFHILQNADTLPAWLMLGREIERDLEELQRLRDRYRNLRAVAVASSNVDIHSLDLDIRREAFRELARKIRKKQDQFNIDAPGRLTERSGLWVDYEVAKLDEPPTVAP